MKQQLITLLETFKYPIRLQGSIRQEEAYPESFFTYWNSDTYDGHHYDNKAIFYVWDFDVNFYSIDPTLVNTVLEQARILLKQNGFIIAGKGYDVPSDEPTHTGRGMTVLKIEKNTGG